MFKSNLFNNKIYSSPIYNPQTNSNAINSLTSFAQKPKFYIISNKDSLTQSESKEILINKIKLLMGTYYPNTEYSIEEHEGDTIKKNKSLNYIFDHMGLNELNTNNDPIVAIQSGMSIEAFKINDIIMDKHTLKVKNKLDNFLFYNVVNDYETLRDSFKLIQDDIKNSIIIIPIKADIKYDENYAKIISLLKSKTTHIIFIENDDLKKKLKLQDDVIYEYYPPKLPYKILEYETRYAEILKDVDVSTYLSVNPIGIQLNYGLFRDEYTFNERFSKNIIKDYEKNLKYGYNIFERKKLRKMAFFAFRNVKKLANTEKESIEESWKKPNKHYLFIWVPNLAFIKERVFDYILFGNFNINKL